MSDKKLKKVLTSEDGVKIFKMEKEEKTPTKRTRIVERSVVEFCKAGQAGFKEYIKLHEESNEKKKDGWLKDIVPNVIKAELEAIKSLKVDEIFN